ncbi:MAG: alcohol dehydrogenase catalytic domain-containing protein [Actinomycetota bacterium]|nr:alcohol dehydrogenase catalytic domain-containing protein [Actinomycetota bacterium]
MRAAFFEGMKQMVVRDADPPALRDGDARVRVLHCGICGSDLSLYKTGILAGPDQVLGHEFSGVVEEDRSGTFQEGARVVAWPARGCGECLWCREGHPRYCLDPPSAWGAYAEQVAVPAQHLIPVPDSLDDRTASLAEPLGVGVRAVDMAGVKEGDLVFVSGLGSIGLLAIAALLDRGARVIGADIREERRELGKEFGCEVVFDPVAEDPFWKTLAVDQHGPAFAFECSGSGTAVQMAFNVCGHMGTVVLLGIPFEPAVFIPAVMSVKEQRALSISGPSRESMEESLALLERRPDTARVITGDVPLEEIDRAMLDLVEGRGGVKVLVDPRV